jgi:MoxR-like ATPase
MDYIVTIVSSTRGNDQITLGVSPRGTLALMNASMAYAMIIGRSYVLPDDVQRMARVVLPHRMIMSSQASFKNITPAAFIDNIISTTKVPAVS